MRDSLECPNCGRKLAVPTERAIEAVRCSGCGTRLQHDAPLSSEEAASSLKRTPQADPNTPEDINPIPRIARKRSLILRYLDADAPKTRVMRLAFLIGTGLCPILWLGGSIIPPPHSIQWNLFCPGVMVSPMLGLFLMVGSSVLFDVWARWHGRKKSLPHLDRGSYPRKIPGKESRDTSITPSPSQGTIQPDPKPEEPTDA
jgi:hypothetical protein